MNSLLKRSLILFPFFLIVICSSNFDENGTSIPCLNNSNPNADFSYDCVEGFTNFDCCLEISPNKINITKFRIKQFPNLDWDTPIGTDIYIKLYEPTINLIYTSLTYASHADGNVPFYYDEIFNSPLESSISVSIFMLELMDFVGDNILPNNDSFMYSKIFSNYVETQDSNLTSSFEI